MKTQTVYEVYGKEMSTDYAQQRYATKNMQEACKLAREWLNGRYLSQSEAWVEKVSEDEGKEIKREEIYHAILDENGKVKSVHPYGRG